MIPMTTLEPVQNGTDLSYLHDMILQAIENEDFPQAMSLAEQGKITAQEQDLSDWFTIFEELRLQIGVAIHVSDNDFDEEGLSNVQEDFTVLNGVGASTAQKLLNARFSTIEQIARSTPQQIMTIKGFGATTANKLIENALAYLQTDPVDPTNYSIESDLQGVDTSVVGKPEQEKQEPPTPYEKLLERSASIEDLSIIDNTHSTSDLEKVDEEIFQEKEFEEEEEFTEEKPKAWFDSRYQYSRLTSVHPPKTIAESQQTPIHTPTLLYEDYREEEEENREEETTLEPSYPDDDSSEVIKEFTQEECNENINPPTINQSIVRDLSKPQIFTVESNIEKEEPDMLPKATHNISPQPSQEPMPQSISPYAAISTILKEHHYQEFPKYQFPNLQFFAYKHISITDHTNVLLLIPIQVEEQSKELVITEHVVNFKKDSKENISTVIELLHYRDNMVTDITNEANFFQFLRKYLNLEITVEKTSSHKSLFVRSGQSQYRILIEPVLITTAAPYFLEATIPFAYQRSTNLHVLSYEHLAEFLHFLEAKYEVIERYGQKKAPLQRYQEATKWFNRNLRRVSLSVMGYSGLLTIMFFSQWFYLLRIFINVGYAVMGIYFFSVGYLFYRFHLVKKMLYLDFETPYYLHNVHLNEATLIMLKEEYPEEVIVQFGFECLHEFPTSISNNMHPNKSMIKEGTSVIPSHAVMSSFISSISSKFDQFLED